MLSPLEIVSYLNRFIVSQDDAKKKLAIAFRNRWRRKQIDGSMSDEIYPPNILMVGPTGVGKTEIARRLAQITSSPFIKVEATKFTEVGYVGRDVESIIRDLVELAMNDLKNQRKAEVQEQASKLATNRVLDALIGSSATSDTRQKFYEQLINNELNDRYVEITTEQDSQNILNQGTDLSNITGGGHIDIVNISDFIGKALGDKKKKKRKVKVKEALDIFTLEEASKLIDNETLIRDLISIVENDSIVFIDEIDKIATRSSEGPKGDVSTVGVQRDLLGLTGGTTVVTKYGQIKTDHILFIAAGAFHMAQPSDLLPELQGRFPVRVDLNPLGINEMIKIMTDPEYNLVKQYTALMKVDNIDLDFTNTAIIKIAENAVELNDKIENVGARRLHGLFETIVEEVSFNFEKYKGQKIVIDHDYIDKAISGKYKSYNYEQFIL